MAQPSHFLRRGMATCQRNFCGYVERSEFFFKRPNIQFLSPRRAVLVVQGKKSIGYGADIERTILALRFNVTREADLYFFALNHTIDDHMSYMNA